MLPPLTTTAGTYLDFTVDVVDDDDEVEDDDDDDGCGADTLVKEGTDVFVIDAATDEIVDVVVVVAAAAADDDDDGTSLFVEPAVTVKCNVLPNPNPFGRKCLP